MNDVTDADGSAHSRRLWITLVLVAGAIAAAALAVSMLLPGKSAPVQVTGNDSLDWAEVVITDLAQERTFAGTLRSVDDDPIVTQHAGTITQIADRGTSIVQGQSLFAINNRPVILLYGDLASYRDIAIGEDAYTPWSQINGKLTWVPAEGEVIEQGQALYRVDDRPIVLLYGDQPGYRDLGVAGSDPRQVALVSAAEAALRAAQAELAALTTPPTAQQIKAAEWELTAAHLALDDARGPSAIDALDVAIAERQLEQAKNERWAAQILRDSRCGTVDKGGSSTDCDVAQASVQSSEEAVRIAEIHLQKLMHPPSERQIADTEAQVAQAQAVLDSLLKAPEAAQIAAAQAQVTQRQAELDILTSEMASSGPGDDVRQLESALVGLGYDPEGTVRVDDTFTDETEALVRRWQESVGATVDGIVHTGEVVFLPGPAQVLERLAMPGSYAGGNVLRVSSGEASHGADVEQLQKALVNLGHDAGGSLVADGTMNAATIQAIVALQRATGMAPDGIIDRGDVVFLDGPARVTQQLCSLGDAVSVGSRVLRASLAEKVVQMPLPAQYQAMVAVGDAVTIEMPDQTEVPGTVTYRSNTATPDQNGAASFEVRITLDAPDVAQALDWAPVDVHIVANSVESVMAVPVSALVALLEGGYAVEIDAGLGRTRYVGVEVGFCSSNNLIEVISSEIKPGDKVVVP